MILKRRSTDPKPLKETIALALFVSPNVIAVLFCSHCRHVHPGFIICTSSIISFLTRPLPPASLTLNLSLGIHEGQV